MPAISAMHRNEMKNASKSNSWYQEVFNSSKCENQSRKEIFYLEY